VGWRASGPIDRVCRTYARNEEKKATPRRLERTDLAQPASCALRGNLAAAGPASPGIACIEFSKKFKKGRYKNPFHL
jgi:hypothetical protein